MFNRFTGQKIGTQCKIAVLLIVIPFLLVCGRVMAQNSDYRMSSWFTTSGNNSSAGEGYVLNGSMGMSVVGQMNGEDFTLHHTRLTSVLQETPQFSCSNVAEIPLPECEALVALFDNTGGPNWDNITGWRTTNTPCSWYGVICEEGRVTQLTLNGEKNEDGSYDHFGLIGDLPSEIGNLTNLSSLVLLHNQLISLPSEIGSLTNLKNLHLRNNQINALPAEIWTLPNLTNLHLDTNQLSTISPEIANLVSLSVLDLGYNQLSTIPSEIGALANLTRLVLTNNPLGMLQSEIWNLTTLTTLILQGTQLTVIPPDVGNLTNLTTLDLDANRLSTLPAEIWNLTNLTTLDLDTNRLSMIPPEIGNLTNLTTLDLDANQLSSIPSEIGLLTNLTDVYLSANQLTAVPSEFSNLTNLTDLRLGYNRIVVNDAALAAFLNENDSDWLSTQTIAPTGLDATALSENSIQLTWNPVAFTDRGGYHEVSIATTGTFTVHGNTLDKQNGSYIISALAPSTTHSFRVRTYTPIHGGEAEDIIGDDQQNELWSEYSAVVSATTQAAIVGALVYDCTKVSEIPMEECEALTEFYNSTEGQNWFNSTQKWLEPNTLPCNWYGILCEDGHVIKINLAGNNLSGSIPAFIQDLSLVTELDLSFNEVNRLPSEIGQLAELVRLNLTSNRLSNLPSEIGQLGKLIHLDADANFLSELPQEIGDLDSLMVLNVSDNQLIELPSTIGMMANLVTFNTSDNLLTALPSTIGDLTKLTELDASDNQLAALPAEIGTLTNLLLLDLSDNQLSILPDEIGGLVNLANLNLSDNNLTEIPSTISNFVNSTNLNFSENNLTTLPSTLGELSQLEILDVSHNQLITLTDDIKDMTLLKVLNVRHNNLTTLPESVSDLSNLKTLDAGFNQLTSVPLSIYEMDTKIYLDNSPALQPLVRPEVPSTPEPSGSWTLLIYAIGDNNLHSYLGFDNAGGMLYLLRQLAGNAEEGVQIAEKGVQIAVLFDGNSIDDSAYYTLDEFGEWTSEELPEQDMNNPKTLTTFLQWGYARFPDTTYYALSILGHANGVVGIGYDKDVTKLLKPSHVYTAIQNAPEKHLKVLHIDACSFGLYENTLIAEGLADYVIASPNTAWGIFPYEEYRVIANKHAAPVDYVKQVAQLYSGNLEHLSKPLPHTISVFDMKNHHDLKYEIGRLGNNLARHIEASRVNDDFDSHPLKSIRDRVQTYDSGDYNLNKLDSYVDLQDLIIMLKEEDIGGAKVAQDVKEIQKTLGTQTEDSGFVLYAIQQDLDSGTVDFENAHGIGIYYPYSQEHGGDLLKNYKSEPIFPNLPTDWGWYEFLDYLPELKDSKPVTSSLIRTRIDGIRDADNIVYMPVIKR